MQVTPMLVQAADAVLHGALEPLAMLNLHQDLFFSLQASLNLDDSCSIILQFCAMPTLPGGQQYKYSNV